MLPTLFDAYLGTDLPRSADRNLITAGQNTFELTEIAVPSTVTVTVNGAPNTDWTFDLGLNAVVFERLDPGATVKVDYSTGTGCP